MKFCWTTIAVKDMESSLCFYRDIVGLVPARRMKPSPEQEIAFLGTGGTQVELIWNGKKGPIQAGQDISMGFEAASLDTLMETFRKEGITLHSGPFQPNPGIKFLYILDPDGHKLQFVEFMKQA